MTSPAGIDPLSPSALEIVASAALDEPPRRRRPPRSRVSPRTALEDAVLRALVRGSRCSVSFSGGRDSSLVLALACHVARREGLPLPVAVTLRHKSAESDEQEWQELVISHLGLDDWVRVDVADSMDLLGQQAVELLELRGPLLPPNAYLHMSMVRAAPPGVMLTGAGGDEILGTRGGRLAQIFARKTRPRPRDVLSAGLAVAPARVRTRWKQRHASTEDLGWILPDARRELAERMAATDAAASWRWDIEAVDFVTSRTATLGRQALALVGAGDGTLVSTPLMEPDFVQAFAATAGAAGPTDRTTSMRLLASDLLPESVITRSTKATFGGVVWGPGFREFAANPHLCLPDDVAGLVDLDLLKENWSADEPHYATMSLAQVAYLATPRG